MLDPNGDNYTSASTSGYTTSDITQSELQFASLPQLQGEPTSDLGPGPNCKFTDFVDLSADYKAVGFRVDAAGNLMWRIRLGGSAPNTKAYSIAIDTDGKFGFTGTNADPNAVVGNPGFEIEISLVTGNNNGVRLYNIDGRSTANGNPPNGAGPDGSLVQLAYDDYAQKSVALTTNCGDLDVFYDFYMPASVVNANVAGLLTGGNILSTPIRMVANTMIAPHTMTKTQNISDLAGIDDAAYGYNYDQAFTDLITVSTPVTPGGVGTGGGTIAIRSVPPIVNSPIQTGASSVSGTSVEPAGSTIIVYQNGVQIGTTTVQANGTWTISGLAGSVLVTGQIITATVQNTAAGETVSALSNQVPVRGPGVQPTCATAAPTVNCATERGLQGTLVPNAILRFYNLAGQQIDLQTGLPASTTYTATAGGQYPPLCNGNNTNPCNTAQPCLAQGSYTVTQQAPGVGQCESAPTTFCLAAQNGNTTTTATPSITTNPVLNTATSITGTAAANARVLLYSGGLLITTTTATAGGAFTFTGLALTVGENLTVRAQSTGSCISALSAVRTVQQRTAIAPVVNSPIYAGATSVSGTSVEPAGSTITVFVNGVSVGTTTVQANGTWSLSGLTALTAGQTVNATVLPTGAAVSGLSNTVTVQTRTTVVPVITGAYTEGNTTVTGTIAAVPAGTVINLYEDDFLIGTTTVSGGGNWSINLTGGTADTPVLYAGGVLNATATQPTQAESVYSNAVIVGCPTLTANNTVTAAPNPICEGETTNVSIANSSEIVYTLFNATTNAPLSNSALGGANPLVITSFPLTANTTIRVRSIKIGAVTCTQDLTTTPAITVGALPLNTLSVGATPNPVCPGQSTTVTVASSQLNVSYQLFNGATPVGAAVLGTGNTINLPTGALASNTTFTVVATNTAPPNCSRPISGTVLVTVRVNCSADVATTISGPTVGNPGATVTYTATTTNSGTDVATNVTPTITLAPNLAAGSVTLPSGATYNATTGVVTFATTAQLNAAASVTNSVQVVLPASGTVQATAASTSLVPDPNAANNNGSQPAATVTTVINQLPVANTDTRNTPQATAITFSVTANDTDADGTINAATVDLNTGVAGIQTTRTVTGQGTFTVDNLGNVTFTPVAGFTGISTITYAVQDNNGGTSGAGTIRVNVGPLAANDATTTAYNAPVSVNVTTNDADVSGLNVATVDLDPNTAGIQNSFTVTGQGTFAVNALGIVTFAPSGTFVGTTAVSYTVQDNVAGNAATSNVATFSVTTTTTAPTANNDATTTPSNTAVTLNVTANDTDPDGTINAATVDLDPATPGVQTTFTAAGQGTFSVNSLGVVTFTPALNFTGTSTISYRVQDNVGTLSNAATISVAVGPVATNDVATSTNGQAVRLSGGANDTDVDGINFASVDLDPNTAGVQTTFTVAGQGTFTVDTATGEVIFTPDASYAGGTVSIPYVVSDNIGVQSNPASLTVTVVPFADVVTTISGPPSVSPGQTVTYVVTTTNNGPAAANDVLVRVQLPTNLLNGNGTPFSVTGATYNPSTGELVFNNAGTLGVGQSIIASFSFRLPNNGAASGIASSTSSTGDPNLANNNGSLGASQVSTNATLPVELTRFTAQAEGHAVALAWTTVSEKNSAHFAVERSADGRNFAEIGRRDAAGNTSARHEYAWTDARPLAGANYYRLRQVDRDGSTSFSAIRTVRLDGAAVPAALFPNPATANVTLTLPTTEGTWLVRICDLSGRQVLRLLTSAAALELPTTALPTGTYVVCLTGPAGQTQTLRLVRE